jgi:ParB-like chromosome segregation protein Spo0J
METKTLELRDIILDPAVQPRVALDEDYIEELKAELQAGANLPEVMVFFDGTVFHIADGFHRYLAHQRAGRNEIPVQIHEGGKREAQLYAVGSNATHGKRRTNADKRKAVETLLRDAEWGGWSDRHISKVCRVSQPLVSDVRNELTESGFQFPATRMCSDGREMDVTQIGSTRGQDQQLAEEPPEDTNPTETTQVDDAEPAGEDPASTPESSASVAHSQPDDAAESDGPQPEAEPEGGTAPEAEEMAPVKRDESPAEKSEPSSIEIDVDIPTLKAKVAELEALLRERDLRISELEKRVQELENDNAYWFKEFDRLDDKEKRNLMAKWTEQKPSRRPLLSF